MNTQDVRVPEYTRTSYIAYMESMFPGQDASWYIQMADDMEMEGRLLLEKEEKENGEQVHGVCRRGLSDDSRINCGMRPQDIPIMAFTGIMWIAMLPFMLIAVLVGFVTQAGVEAGTKTVRKADAALTRDFGEGYVAQKRKAVEGAKTVGVLTVAGIGLLLALAIIVSLSLWGSQFGRY